MHQPKSSAIRAAAAGIAACSLAGVTQADEIQWMPGPSELAGAYTQYFDAANSISFIEYPTALDFDGDGVNEFTTYFYNYFHFSASFGADPLLNPTTDFLSVYSGVMDSNGSLVRYNDLNQLAAQGSIYSVNPRDIGLDGINGYAGNFANNRGYFGFLFTGGDGQRYLGYVDLFEHKSDELTTAIILDSGYTPLPELTSFLGDTNLDSDIDIADLLTAMGSYGQAANITNADTNGDAVVDSQDLSYILQNMTSTSVPGGTGVVPVGENGDLIYFANTGLVLLETYGEQIHGYSIAGAGLIATGHNPLFTSGSASVNVSSSDLIAGADYQEPYISNQPFEIGHILPADLTEQQLMEAIDEAVFVRELGGGVFRFTLRYFIYAVGDTDNDGDVDDFDLLGAIANYTGSLDPGVGGKGVAQGDTDADQDVDDFDLLNMISGYTGSLPAGASATVPEPSSLGLLALGGVGLLNRRRRA